VSQRFLGCSVTVHVTVCLPFPALGTQSLLRSRVFPVIQRKISDELITSLRCPEPCGHGDKAKATISYVASLVRFYLLILHQFRHRLKVDSPASGAMIALTGRQRKRTSSPTH
jgi:hypothetical protein